MLKYLINFGVDKEIDSEAISLNYEIDINDISILESQINKVRMTHYELIKINDSLQEEYMSKKSALTKKMREMHIDYPNRTDRINATATNIEHSELTDSIEALKDSMRMIGNRLDFVKSDIRILTNSMYRKL